MDVIKVRYRIQGHYHVKSSTKDRLIIHTRVYGKVAMGSGHRICAYTVVYCITSHVGSS